MLWKISISNKYCSFEPSIHVFYLEIYYSLHKNMKQIVIKEIFLEHQMRVLARFLKDHVTDWGMAAENSALPSQE